MSLQKRKPEKPDPRTNLLLASLDPAVYDLLMRDAKVLSFKYRKRLYQQDDAIDYVYFPMTCMVSLLVITSDKASTEMATVGREGVVGASELMQSQGAMTWSIIQIPGTAARIERDWFLKVVRTRSELQDLMHRHLFALMRQVLYGSACNRLHTMKERCARWLLMTHDRAAQDSFPLTQEFLAHMLAVRRATVSVATGMLKKAGLITYVRGRVTVLNRPGLESASCGCYQATIRAYDSIFRDIRPQRIRR